MILPYIDGEPTVPLEIQTTNHEWIQFDAYIDSGAGYSVFHGDHARLLGLDLISGRKIYFTVGDGEQIPAYVHKVRVKFAGQEFVAQIAFSEDLGVGTNLLGLVSFFDKFTICFHHIRQYVEIQEFKG